ncbi:MarR family transcriptional regulator [Mycolicibacterium sp.]|uniref:MarR family transcriptional regulator n=1 Tax=Mycolicibacterium sp. TaxID=2320850 RepID=UPI003D0A6537
MKTKAASVEAISALLYAVVERYDDGTDPEREYLMERCPARFHAVVRELPAAAVHLMAAIGESDTDGGVNIVGLAARSGHLKGTVSKHVQRLVDAGLVERTPVPGNRKEIRLQLTADGRALDRVHRQMHDEKDAGLREFLSRYTAAELQTIAKVLDDLLHAETRGVRVLPRP